MGLGSLESHAVGISGPVPPTWLTTAKVLPADTLSGEATPDSSVTSLKPQVSAPRDTEAQKSHAESSCLPGGASCFACLLVPSLWLRSQLLTAFPTRNNNLHVPKPHLPQSIHTLSSTRHVR